MTGADLLHPGLLHHIVNTLGWQALRPLQEAAAPPVLAGEDALLLAPTAGGKTEAALFPLLSRAVAQDWQGLSVLYVCPLRALLNNLEPRVTQATSWVGRRAGLWHGDVGAGARSRLLLDPPEVLLTTPESLEAMLVSTRVDERRLFADLQAIVVDEVHAFAGDDRGWHLLAVMARLEEIAGRRLQRLGLSATVGNPTELLTWLRGGDAGGCVIAPPDEGPAADLQLDFVGTLDGAATVLSAVHRGQKRLVFADSRRTVEELAGLLRARGVEVFLSHSSLSRDERHRAEQAFSDSRDCVIVSTSTLELGIDVGDLDRVVQIGAPRTVASFLQRLGRTGRRAGTVRNALLLALDDDQLLRGAGLLRLHSEGYVEPVVPPELPAHVLAQQVLALCLQDGALSRVDLCERLAPPLPRELFDEVVDHLLGHGYLDRDGDLLFVGPAAERRFGRRHFLELLSVFTSDPELTVLAGRVEVGRVDPLVLTQTAPGPRVLALAGRGWRVTHVDWRRRKVFVEPSELLGRARWSGATPRVSWALCDAMRRVVLDGITGPARLSHRATTQLAGVRDALADTVSASGNVITTQDERRWWTWGGGRANAVLIAGIRTTDELLVDPNVRAEERYVRLRDDVAMDRLRALADVRNLDQTPEVGVEALRQLTFHELLPTPLAQRVVGLRLADLPGAQAVLARGVARSEPRADRTEAD